MAHQHTPAPARRQPGVWDEDPERDRVRLEILESLPVRLEDKALADILALARDGKTPRVIGWAVRLHPLVVTLEVGRAHDREKVARAKRRLTAEQKATRKAEAAMPRLERYEMTRLALGTHIPNQPLRDLIAQAQRSKPDLTVNQIVTAAGYRSTSEGRRLLGYMRQSGCKRAGQTIRPDHAARVVRALGRAPAEVVGL
jgi:hypothetical protein